MKLNGQVLIIVPIIVYLRKMDQRVHLKLNLIYNLFIACNAVF